MKLRASLLFLFTCLCASLLFALGACTSDDDAGTGSPGETGDGGATTDGSTTGSKDGGGSGGDTGAGTDGGGGTNDGGGTSNEGGVGGGSFTVGGLLSGLATGDTVVLQDNGGDTLTLTANGAFTFATSVANGAGYAVTVLSQPTTPAQTCVLSGATGTISGGSVGTVEVVCTTAAFTVGGTVGGLTGTGLALNDGSEDLVITANGAFTFAHPLASGAAFTVTVKTQPTNPVQTCKVAAGNGTIGAANVTSVNVNCDANKFSISGTVTGLTGTGLVLQDNAADNLSVTTGTFAFPTSIASGKPYAVTVLTPPSSPAQTCTVANGSGTVAAADITNVVITCSTVKYTIGGTLSGLGAGDSVTLLDNGGDNLTVSANGMFTFATPIASGMTYAVTAMAPTGPVVQTCAVTNGSSKVGAANVTNVTVACTATTFTVGGTITGLVAGQMVVLQDNLGDNLTVNAGATTFTFATPVASGAAYAITVKTPPATGTCHLFERTGNVGNGPVTTVTATCGIDYYVTAGTGSDAATGLSAAAPWKTLTHAIATVPVAGGIINVAPGTYDATNGESFPIEPRNDQTLLGDPTFRGIGQTGSTIVSGSGPYQPGGEVGALYSFVPIIAVPPGVTGVALRGLDVVGPVSDTVEGIVVDGSSVTVANVTVSGASVEAIADLNAGNLTLLDSTIEDAVTLVADATTVIKARRNNFVGGGDATAVKIGFTSAVLTGTNVDLGTASNPGGNSIVSSATGYGLHIATATTGVEAAGNTWQPNVQGSTASGTYPAQLVTGPVTPATGQNYYLVAGSSVQF